MRTIQPVVPMASPSCLMRLMMRAWLCVSRLQDEHDNEDDDQDECSYTDTDTHDLLLSVIDDVVLRVVPWEWA